MSVVHISELANDKLNKLIIESEAMKHGKGIQLNKFPNFSQFKFKPYEEKLRIYAMAKDLRRSLINCGFELSETHEQYIERITEELGI